jgi:hypothetical protein
VSRTGAALQRSGVAGGTKWRWQFSINHFLEGSIMKRIYAAVILGALAVGSAQADEVMSGITNPGNFAPVTPSQPVATDAVETSSHRAYDEAFSGVGNPGNFAPVTPSQHAATDALETSSHRAYDEVFSGVTNPVGQAKSIDRASVDSQTLKN